MDAEAHKALLGALNARRNGEVSRIELAGRDLRGLYAPGADLVGAQLAGAKVQAAGLPGARMARVDLSGADLSGCDLAGADLTDANLRGANLTDALVDDAIFTNADLRGACFGGILGDPLSLATARMDRETVERSGFTDADVARFLARGVDFDEPSESLPPSLRGGREAPRPSLALSLRPLEVAARQQIANHDELEMPASLRAFRELSAFIEEARRSGHISLPPGPAVDAPRPPSAHEELAPLSLAPPPPAAAPEQLQDFTLPRVGEEYLGVRLQSELTGGTVTATFLGVDPDGQQVVVRVFNPACPGAALQLPAFQRGVRALNRMQGVEGGKGVVSLLGVATDLTGYLVRYYENGCLQDLMEVAISVEGKVELFRSVCRAVGALHGEGLLLRCLKPQNILVDGLEPIVSEIDMVDLPALRQSSRDLFGYGVYAAPEEIVGQGTRSPTADVYALGQLLRYMLTGPKDVVRDASIPQPLMQIIERATALDPALRYQYVDELVADLDRFATQGAATVLRTSLRPAAVSRLAARPLTAARPIRREAPELGPLTSDTKSISEEGHWLSPVLERGLAAFGLAVGLLLVAGHWLRPGLALDLEGYALVPAALIGLVAWFLPGLPGRPGLFRGVSWAVLTTVVFFVDFGFVSALRWESDLRGDSLERKAEAVSRLARLGQRGFSRKNLEGVSLRATDLGSADFQGASLRGSDLSGAFLMEARFAGADVTDADFTSADLRGADLDFAIGLEQALCNRRTLLPEDFQCRHGHLARLGG